MVAKTVGILSASVIVVAVAITALALGPLALLSRSNPGANPDRPGGPGPHPLAFEKPAWNAGDSWTYTSSASRDDGPGSAIATGTLTRQVESADADRVNVSVAGSFQTRWTLAPDATGSAGSIMLAHEMYFTGAAIEGYTWYRASDLATLKEVRTVHFDGSFEMDSGSYPAAYTATVETTFEPALNVWSFPLQANEAWTATSTATVHATAQWKVDTPAEPWSFQKQITFTRDVRLALVSGSSQDIVTPAGTFESIPVWLGLPSIGAFAPVRAPGLADGLDEDMPVPREHATAAWFSGSAKNVVKLAFDTGDAHLDLALTEYHLG